MSALCEVPTPSFDCTALMLKALELDSADRVLEIGTGSGTQTNVWAQNCKEVITIDLKLMVDPEEVAENAYFYQGDGAEGKQSAAPFDAIVCTCGVKEIPQPWVEQLKDGGRLVVPVGEARCQKLCLFIKESGQLIAKRVLAYVRFVMMRAA